MKRRSGGGLAAAETERFVRTPFTIYENEPNWVPPLYFERKRFFDPSHNPYFGNARVAYFIARKGGRDVGTIAPCIDGAYQDEADTAFFGFFEFVDDVEVAEALLAAAREWSIERGMERLIGPFNFNTNHEFGLVVDGFEDPPMVANPCAWCPGTTNRSVCARRWTGTPIAAIRRCPMQKMIRSRSACSRGIRDRDPLSRLFSLGRGRREGPRDLSRRVGAELAHVRVSDREFDFIAEGSSS